MSTPRRSNQHVGPAADHRQRVARQTPYAAAATLFLLLFTTGIFARVVTLGFVGYDDVAHVIANPLVIQGPSFIGLRAAFVSTMGFFNWTPLTWLSLMLDAAWSGGNPAGYHLTNLLFHAANTVLLLSLLHRMTGSFWRAWLVAALFAVHPLRVESVAWIAERRDELFMFFGLLTMLAYTAYTRRRSGRLYVLVAVLYALCLMAKPMLVTLPLLLLVLDYWPLGRWKTGRFIELLLEKIPLLALAVIIAAVTIWAQQKDGALGEGQRYPLIARLGNAAVSYARYAGKMLWFDKLSVFYPLPAAGWPAGLTISCAAGLVAITALAFTHRRGRPWLIVGWLWFLVTLLPVIGLVQVGNQAMADRYTYFTCVGLLIMAAWSIPAETTTTAGARLASGAAVAAVLGVLAWSSWRQVVVWRDADSLWEHALAVDPENYMAMFQLGWVRARQGQTSEALSLFQKTLATRPNEAVVLNAVAIQLIQIGQEQQAQELLRQSLRLEPDDPVSLSTYGQLLARNGSLDGAMEFLRRAQVQAPRSAKLAVITGQVLFMAGQQREALAEFTRATELDPFSASAWTSLANAGIGQSAWSVALDAANHARQIDPRDPAVRALLATAMAGGGDLRGALAELAAAEKELGPDKQLEEARQRLQARPPAPP